jgi:hypothetical protein
MASTLEEEREGDSYLKRCWLGLHPSLCDLQEDSLENCRVINLPETSLSLRPAGLESLSENLAWISIRYSSELSYSMTSVLRAYNGKLQYSNLSPLCSVWHQALPLLLASSGTSLMLDNSFRFHVNSESYCQNLEINLRGNNQGLSHSYYGKGTAISVTDRGGT